MNVTLMKKLIAAMDSCNMSESFPEGKTIENETDIDSLVTNWNALKKAVAEQDGGQTEQEKANAVSGQESIQAAKDIEAWATRDKEEAQSNSDIEAWAAGKK